MKVKVIYVTGTRDLAIGKTYDVIRQKENGNFVIINEAGREVSFKASRFELVPEIVTFKAGDVLKDSDDRKYQLIRSGKLVALLDVSIGEVTNGFHPVEDTQSITDDEMSLIDSEWTSERLVKA